MAGHEVEPSNPREYMDSVSRGNILAQWDALAREGYDHYSDVMFERMAGNYNTIESGFDIGAEDVERRP